MWLVGPLSARRFAAKLLARPRYEGQDHPMEVWVGEVEVEEPIVLAVAVAEPLLHREDILAVLVVSATVRMLSDTASWVPGHCADLSQMMMRISSASVTVRRLASDRPSMPRSSRATVGREIPARSPSSVWVQPRARLARRIASAISPGCGRCVTGHPFASRIAHPDSGLTRLNHIRFKLRDAKCER